MQATIEDLFQCHRKTVALSIAKAPNVLVSTDYVLDVDVRWASALSAKTMKRLDKDVRPSITCFGEIEQMDIDTPAINGVNGANGHANGVNGVNGANGVDDHDVSGELMDDMDENADGDLTPGRRRRQRPQINYNLKLLSDKAQKKEDRRKRQSQKAKNGTADGWDDCGVTYLFREQFHQDDYSCVLCAVPLPTFPLLRAHYKLAHDDYAFEFQTQPRIISISRNFGRPGGPLKAEVYQLGLPRGVLDLSAFLDGDESWITSRQGSENGREIGPVKTVAPRPPRDEVRNFFINVKERRPKSMN